MVAVRKIIPKPSKLQNVLYLLPKERPWMTNSNNVTNACLTKSFLGMRLHSPRACLQKSLSDLNNSSNTHDN